ncbi:GTP cyclohydrolase II [Catellatospora sichuanensis]|uniref:GTP cyclohydrolase II n=1 Tax=Catellatospora sichuanensis TaxID=1969805 RepID=UPI0011837E12|nr:GTP cyclohydrolase II [Catellatospora sichuanensis]
MWRQTTGVELINLQTGVWGEVRVVHLSSSGLGEGEGVAVFVGKPHIEPAPLVRIHSRCLFGELFSSFHCDCGEQFSLAATAIRDEGVGIIIYLDQEGRSAGLLTKMKAYMLSETEGLDTVDAYHAMGLQADGRSYRHAGHLLMNEGIRSIRLLTNNPEKINQIIALGLSVERVPLRADPRASNARYMETKRRKLGHDIDQ